MALACSIAFILSCNKSDNLVWEGRALEYGSNKPVNNATLVLYRGSGEILGGVSFEAIDTLVTGADAEYKFKFLDGPYGYEIRSRAHLYFDGVHAQNTINNGKTKKDLILDPHAWLRIFVKNVNPQDSADFLSIGLSPGDCPKGFSGMIVDTFMICNKYKGNRNQNLRYAVTKRSTGRVELVKEILMGAHDTTDILIEY